MLTTREINHAPPIDWGYRFTSGVDVYNKPRKTHVVPNTTSQEVHEKLGMCEGIQFRAWHYTEVAEGYLIVGKQGKIAIYLEVIRACEGAGLVEFLEHGNWCRWDKGLKDGACNRASCQKHPATWYNTGTRSWYCAACAALINNVSIGSPLCFPDGSVPCTD